MTARIRVALLAGSLVAAISGCGQMGPLELPENARPIERVDAPAEPDQPTDDERQDER
jgi:predicted small lipoprotein YifL